MSRVFETPVGTSKRRLHIARNRLRRQTERAATSRPRKDRKGERRRRERTCV
jgi:hypothetical protein